jgi:hypothetical protein
VTTPHLAGHPAASQQAIVEAARLMLAQMGLSPGDLVAGPADRPPVPTFAEYVPVVSAAVTAGTRRAYGSYWNRVLEHWGERRLDEIAPPWRLFSSRSPRAAVRVRDSAASRRGSHSTGSPPRVLSCPAPRRADPACQIF